MAVRVSKPAFNLRSKLNELDRPVGAFGNQVLATENRYDASKLIGSGRKNFLINGDFKISQRGTFTSAQNVTDDAYYLDRWKMRESGTAITMTHNKDITITEAGGIKTNSMKIDITNSDHGYWAIRQVVEDYAAVSGQTVTFSCWVRGVGQKLFYRLWAIGNIGDGHALTEDWQLYTETFSLPAFTQAADSSNGCVVSLGNYAEGNVYNHTADWCEIALFQVEIGRSHTEFEQRSFGEELQLCQRYYQKSFMYADAPGTAAHQGGVHVVSWGDGNGAGLVLPVRMRDAGDWRLWPTNSTNVGKVSSHGTERDATVTYPGETGYSFLAITSGTANTYVRFQYDVDAEY